MYWIADSTYRAKYPLAIVKKLLDTFGDGLVGGVFGELEAGFCAVGGGHGVGVIDQDYGGDFGCAEPACSAEGLDGGAG